MNQTKIKKRSTSRLHKAQVKTFNLSAAFNTDPIAGFKTR